MGQESRGVTAERHDHEDKAPERAVNELQTHVRTLRADLDAYVGELDRRRHELFDVGGQIRKRAGLLVAVGGAMGVLAGVLYGVRRSPSLGSSWRAGRERSST